MEYGIRCIGLQQDNLRPAFASDRKGHDRERCAKQEKRQRKDAGSARGSRGPTFLSACPRGVHLALSARPVRFWFDRGRQHPLEAGR